MPPPFLTIDPRTSPITFSPFHSPKISPKSDTDDLGPGQNDDGLVSPLTPNDYSRLSGFPQLSNFDFAFDNRSSLSNLPSPSGPRRLSEATLVEQLVPASVTQNSSPPMATSTVPAAPPQLSIVVPSNAVAGGVHRPAVAPVEDAEAPPPYSRYAGASQPPPAPGSAWGGAAVRVAGVQNMPPTAPAAVYTRGHQGFASPAGMPINGNPRRQSGQRGLHALALADQSQQKHGRQLSKQDTWKEKITTGYWEKEVEVETGSENKRLTRKGRKCILAVTGLILLVIIIIAVVVGVVTTRKDRRHSDSGDSSNESVNKEPQLPDLPGGLHVLKPQGKPEISNSCVSPPSLWSCDLPSDSQFPTAVLSDRSILPEFRFTIKTQKEAGDGADPRTHEETPKATDYANVAGVDGVRAHPKSGEKTKYYISLVTQGSSPIDQGQTTENTHSPVSSSAPSGTSGISVFSSSPGKRALRFKRQDAPAPAKNLFPETVESQPLLFFDRGMSTEHYGFHMYYTKTIRVTSPTKSSASDPVGGLTANAESGTDVKWERTRFRVVIWTKKLSDGGADLLDSQGRIVQASVDVDGFPYPVSIVEDRFGSKGLITYGSGPPQIIQEKPKGDGECQCEWRNWRTKG